MEEWKKCKGFIMYSVSSEGRVRNDNTGRILRANLSHKGYPLSYLYSKGRKHTLPTHRVVACAFLGDAPFPDAQVNHKDGVKTNNSMSNLEWCTNRENATHAIEHNLWKSTPVYVYDIYTGAFLREYKKVSDCAKALNLTVSQVNRCLNEKRRRVKGYYILKEKIDWLPLYLRIPVNYLYIDDEYIGIFPKMNDIAIYIKEKPNSLKIACVYKNRYLIQRDYMKDNEVFHGMNIKKGKK